MRDRSKLALGRSIRKERRRRERGLRDRQQSIGHFLAKAGMFGWLVVVPAVAAAYLGRWLDRRLGTGVLLSAALLLVGAALGCYLAWVALMKEKEPLE